VITQEIYKLKYATKLNILIIVVIIPNLPVNHSL